MTEKQIKDLLRNRRKELGYTMKEVADMVGVSEATISRWESGDIANMRRDKISKLSQALQISPSIIMSWDDQDQNIGQKQTYNDPETEEIAQLISETPGLRALMKASKDLDPNDLKMFTDMVKVYKEKSGE